MSHSLSTVTRSVLVALLSGGVLLGCQKGPAQETGAKVDKAINKLTGKGPAETAGERIAEAVKELRSKHPNQGRTLTGVVDTPEQTDRAFELGIGEKTVKVHRARVMEKMRTGSVAELVSAG